MGLKNQLNNELQKALKRGDTAKAAELQAQIDALKKYRGDRAAGLPTPAFSGPSDYTVRPGDSAESIAGDIFGDQRAAQMIVEANPQYFKWDPTTQSYVFTGKPGDVLDTSFIYTPGGYYDPRLFTEEERNQANFGYSDENPNPNLDPNANTTPDGGYGQQINPAYWGSDPNANRESNINAPEDFTPADQYAGAADQFPNPYIPSSPGGRSQFGQPGGRAAGSARTEGYAPPPPRPEDLPKGAGSYVPPEPGGVRPPSAFGYQPGVPWSPSPNLGLGAPGAPPGTPGVPASPGATPPAGTEGATTPSEQAGAAGTQPGGEARGVPFLGGIRQPEGTTPDPVTQFATQFMDSVYQFSQNPTDPNVLPPTVPSQVAQFVAPAYGMSEYELMTNLAVFYQEENGDWTRIPVGAPRNGNGTTYNIRPWSMYNSGISRLPHMNRIKNGKLRGPGVPRGPDPVQGNQTYGFGPALSWNIRYGEDQ